MRNYELKTFLVPNSPLLDRLNSVYYNISSGYTPVNRTFLHVYSRFLHIKSPV